MLCKILVALILSFASGCHKDASIGKDNYGIKNSILVSNGGNNSITVVLRNQKSLE